MTSQVVFIQGAGEGAYKEDQLLAQSLQKELGSDFNVVYPEMPDEANAPYNAWKQLIQEKIAASREPIILVGHSMGASYLAKILTEIKTSTSIAGIFLLAAPFWGGKGWLYEGYEELELPKNAAATFPSNAKTFLYQTQNDEVVPFEHLALYAKMLPQATVRKINEGGHQFNNNLSLVATDIKSIVL
jgi:predicted alpha/beta hydrolase family esterase